MLPQTPERAAVDRDAAPARRRDPQRALREPDARGSACWSRAIRPGPTRSTTSSGCSPASTSCTATAASPTTTPSSAASRTTRASRSASSATRRAATPSRRSSATSATRGPEGYRKALRVMQLAQKFNRPIVVFIDTPAAYPGVESEERGVAEAIAFNLREMMMLERADRRHRLRRRRQRRRARHRDRRSRADAGVLGLQRHPAGRLRGDPVARREPQGRSGRGAEDHRARSAGARADRRDHSGAGRRRAQRSGAGDRAGRRGARARARRRSIPVPVDERLAARYDKFRRMGGEGPGVHRHGRAGTATTSSRARIAAHEDARLAPPAVRRRAGVGARGGARPASDGRAAAVPARLRRSGRSPGSFLQPVARSPARSVQADRHGPRRSSGSSRRSRGASGSPSTATTTSTASRRPSSSAARSRCSAATSSTSFPSGCATATACSRRRSSGCTPTACR